MTSGVMFSSCGINHWVGKSQTQLTDKWGKPEKVEAVDDNLVYYYSKRYIFNDENYVDNDGNVVKAIGSDTVYSYSVFAINPYNKVYWATEFTSQVPPTTVTIVEEE